MNWRTALLIAKRALGCRIVGHDFTYWSEVEHGIFQEFRSCCVAVCQHHERFDPFTKTWIDTDFRRPGL